MQKNVNNVEHVYRHAQTKHLDGETLTCPRPFRLRTAADVRFAKTPAHTIVHVQYSQIAAKAHYARIDCLKSISIAQTAILAKDETHNTQLA